MFGLDTYSLSVMWPSVLGVLLMAGAMTWGGIKIVQLTMAEPAEK